MDGWNRMVFLSMGFSVLPFIFGFLFACEKDYGLIDVVIVEMAVLYYYLLCTLYLVGIIAYNITILKREKAGLGNYVLVVEGVCLWLQC